MFLENVQAEIRKAHGPVTQAGNVSTEALGPIAGAFSNSTEDSFGGGEGGRRPRVIPAPRRLFPLRSSPAIISIDTAYHEVAIDFARPEG